MPSLRNRCAAQSPTSPRALTSVALRKEQLGHSGNQGSRGPSNVLQKSSQSTAQRSVGHNCSGCEGQSSDTSTSEGRGRALFSISCFKSKLTWNSVTFSSFPIFHVKKKDPTESLGPTMFAKRESCCAQKPRRKCGSLYWWALNVATVRDHSPTTVGMPSSCRSSSASRQHVLHASVVTGTHDGLRGPHVSSSP